MNGRPRCSVAAGYIAERTAAAGYRGKGDQRARERRQATFVTVHQHSDQAHNTISSRNSGFALHNKTGPSIRLGLFLLKAAIHGLHFGVPYASGEDPWLGHFAVEG